ncbi:sulfatase-like hydrolase/transferase [Parenemella sanctibonifatiensis]|uniref:sulfatase-like hydrolase/transferase n=1 Tax=Parenemella sanctibonifatiensis TaxID=2016505 RepID=UPI0011850B7D|nr:sulfatase-like hydrolase/transferase [Parenemella sanctibonifatiensis]
MEEIRRGGVGDNPLTAEDEYALTGALHLVERFFLDPHYGRATPQAPLLLMLSLNEPHYPYATPRADLVDHYLDRVEPFDEEAFDHPFLGGRFRARIGREVTEAEARRATAAYCAMIETMDARVGRLLEALESAGQDLSEWVVMYTSDHGEMLGQHGVWEKQKFFEASVGVPLLLAAPGLAAGASVEGNVSTVDTFATLTELAGIPCPAGLDSRSLVPLARGEAATLPGDEVLSQFDLTNLMIKRGALKYQWYAPADDRETAPEVTFDLAVDPGETRDVTADPTYADQVAQLRARRQELGFG